MLIDQTEYILTHARPGTMLTSLKIMYRTLPKKMNPIQAVSMFVDGLKENGFFAYTEFLKGLSGR